MEFTETLGMRTTLPSPGECRIEIDLDARHMSHAERVHGGVLFAMLDTAMGRAVIASLPEGRGCATVECKINFFRPVQSGVLVATARVANRSRSLAYAEGSIESAEGKLVARASGTFFLTETLAQSERERL